MPEKKQTEGRRAYEWVQALVCSVLTMVLIFTFAVRIVRVSGESMRETLQDQDMLVVLNNWLCGGYEQGEIVILQRDDFYCGEPIVKRVIATEGQTVDIDFDAGVVYVDGTALEEPYTREPTWTQEGTEFPLTVPEGCIFVMGDNRNDSDDSRDSTLGPVDTRCVLGRALLLAVPGPTADTEQRDWSRVGILN